MSMKKKEVKNGAICEIVRSFRCYDGVKLKIGWWFGILSGPEKVDGILTVKISLQGDEKFVRLKDIKMNAKLIGQARDRNSHEKDSLGHRIS